MSMHWDTLPHLFHHLTLPLWIKPHHQCWVIYVWTIVDMGTFQRQCNKGISGLMNLFIMPLGLLESYVSPYWIRMNHNKKRKYFCTFDPALPWYILYGSIDGAKTNV